MKRKFPVVLLVILFCLGPAGDPAFDGGSQTERYRYVAVPEGDETGRKETIDMEITAGGDTLRYETRRVSPAGLEQIEIEMDPAGIRFASRRFSPALGEPAEAEQIRQEHGRAYLMGRGAAGAEKIFDLPGEKYFAVNGSLLILLRSFPFGTDASWPVYMIDFSGASVTVTLRQSGVERITVPAGTFDCYKMEVTVEIPVLKPRIHYWISLKSPHFLVKGIGRQGPFTPSYETSLVAEN